MKTATLAGHTEAVQALLLHRGLMASASADATVRLWNTATHRHAGTCSLPRTLPAEERTAIYALADSEGALWSAHWGGSINVWDAAAGALLRNLSAVHFGSVWGLTALPDQPHVIASAGADGAVRLWDARQATVVHELAAECAVYALAAGAGLIAAGGYDGALRLWEPRAPRQLARVVAHAAPVRSLLVHDDALWSGSTDGTVRCWDLPQLAAGDERWG